MITDEGPFVAARWVHAPHGTEDRAVADTLDALAASMPWIMGIPCAANAIQSGISPIWLGGRQADSIIS